MPSLLPWAALLSLLTLASIGARRHSDERRFFDAVLLTQVVCFANLVWQSRLVQQLAHDAFVALLLYALVGSRCTRVRAVGLLAASAQLVTRHVFDRCLFLWWNVGRNKDNDLVVAVLCVVSTTCPPLLSVWTCVIIGIATHVLPDGPDDAVVWRTGA